MYAPNKYFLFCFRALTSASVEMVSRATASAAETLMSVWSTTAGATRTRSASTPKALSRYASCATRDHFFLWTARTHPDNLIDSAPIYMLRQWADFMSARARLLIFSHVAIFCVDELRVYGNAAGRETRPISPLDATGGTSLCEIDAWFMAPAVDAVAHSWNSILPLAHIMQMCVWRGIQIIGANSALSAKQDYQIFNFPFSSGTPGESCVGNELCYCFYWCGPSTDLIRSWSHGCQWNCSVFMGVKYVDRIEMATA